MKQILNWDAIEAIVKGAARVLLYGPPGTGKTTVAHTAAKRRRLSVYNITLTDETPAAELRGHWVPSGSEWKWMDGPAMLAYRNGGYLVLNEIDKASTDTLDFCHALLDDKKISKITLPNGETVFPHKNFVVIATMNGDIEELGFALQDRFSIALQITEPHPKAIAALPEDLQNAARTPEQYGQRQRPATIRRWSAFNDLRNLPGITEEMAAQAVFAHRASELMDVIRIRDTRNTATIANIPDDFDPQDHWCEGCEQYECGECGATYDEEANFTEHFIDAHYEG